MAPPRFLQANLNHARRAQDLFLQSMAERDCGLGVAAEPFWVPPNDDSWAVAANGSVAIKGRVTDQSSPISRLEAGDGYVAVRWGNISVVGVYFPPQGRNTSRADFEDQLARVEACVRRCPPGPTIIAGDFNAKSAEWGSRLTDLRGRLVSNWAAGLDLRLLNVGSESTCVRWQGESVIDITWANPPAARLTSNWRVLDQETASDHLYIEMAVSTTPPEVLSRRLAGRPRRWALAKLDEDRFRAVTVTMNWIGDPAEDGRIDERVERLQRGMAKACDASMPRVASAPRRSVHWWTEGVAAAREGAVRARATWSRAKRRAGPRSQEAETAYGEYRVARDLLVVSVSREKARALEELLGDLDRDPWGRQYKVVMDKLRPWAPPKTETMDPQFLEEVMGTLFPDMGGRMPFPAPEEAPPEWDEELGVSPEELRDAVRRMKLRKAPGPDGIPGKIWALAYQEVAECLRRIATDCLRLGHFPAAWKVARVVLLPKVGKPAESPSAYRPICLLDEAGKILERIIVKRLVQHLSRTGPDLSSAQYGFRQGRSTVDAILRVRSLSDEITAAGGVALAVSLDIANAFNSLPWEMVGRALRYHNVPPYLVAVIRDYFRDRRLSYTDSLGGCTQRGATCGVPQGSVLGPFLWNLAYDVALRTELPPGCTVIGYADDTLVLSGGADWGEANLAADIAVARVVMAIRALGLRVAPAKTEAVFLHDGSRGAPPESRITVDGVRVPVGAQIHYLGLSIDGTWSFEAHFARLAPKVGRVAASIGRLLPGLGGPCGRVRRLYAAVVNSVALYGAPVWAEEAMATGGIRRILRQMQRPVAIKVARGYGTISHAAATTLAGLPPMELQALAHREAYISLKGLQRRGEITTPSVVRDVRLQARRTLMERWADYLSHPAVSSMRVVEAVLPCFSEWMSRGHGWTSFHLTQVLAGHGCFGEYLCRIGREATTRCHHCEHDRDTAQHTLDECPAWAEERRVLVDVIGPDLSLRAVVAAMARGEDEWRAVSSFCVSVMTQKEEAERARDLLGQAGDPEHILRRLPSRRARGRPRGRVPRRPSLSSSSSDGGGPAGGGGPRGRTPRRPPPPAPRGGVRRGGGPRGRLPRKPSPPARGRGVRGGEDRGGDCPGDLPLLREEEE